MSLPATGRQVHLVSRPHGEVTNDNFAIVEVATPEPADGEVVVANRFFSVDPYMRGRMNDAASYAAPFGLNEPLDGGAVGEVVASRSEAVAVGDFVVHGKGWREFAVVPAAQVLPAASGDLPLSANLGVLGMTGFTAYAGLLYVARMKAGDVVFVSGAAGAVGSIVGQMAKLRGASSVIGSAGTDEKVAFLVEELGFDAAFNYHDGPVIDSLRAAAPNGIDVYFDNVGGDHLEAAISALNVHGRVALCGMISQYNATAPTPGPANLALAIGKRLTLAGFLVGDHNNLRPDFLREAGGWLENGDLQHWETIVEGIENGPAAFIGMMEGENTGKMLVQVSS